MKTNKKTIYPDDSAKAREKKLIKLNAKIKEIGKEYNLLNDKVNDEFIELHVVDIKTGEQFKLTRADREHMLFLRKRQLELLAQLIRMAKL